MTVPWPLGTMGGGHLARGLSSRKDLLRPTKTMRRASTPASEQNTPSHLAASEPIRRQHRHHEKPARTFPHTLSSRPTPKESSHFRFEAHTEGVASSREISRQRQSNKAFNSTRGRLVAVTPASRASFTLHSSTRGRNC